MFKYDVSIIVPAYNAEKYLEECLDSAFAVEVREIIAINDGSTDSTLEILKRYEAEHDNMVLISQENGGLSASRNAGLEVARGKYVVYLDSDDILVADTIVRAYEQCEAKNLDLLTGTFINFYDDPEVAEVDKKAVVGEPIQKGVYDINKVYTGMEAMCVLKENNDYYVPACKYMCRREMLDENGIRFCRGILFEDGDYTLRVMLYSKRVAISDFSFINRRLHLASIEHSDNTVYRVFSSIRGVINMRHAISSFDFECEEHRRIANSEVTRRYRSAANWYRRMTEEQQEELISRLTPEERDELYTNVMSDVGRRDNMESLKERNNRLKENNQKLKERNSALKTRNDKLVERNAALKERNENLKTKVAAQRDKIAEQKQKIADLKERNKAIKESKSYRIGNAIVRPFKVFK